MPSFSTVQLFAVPSGLYGVFFRLTTGSRVVVRAGRPSDPLMGAAALARPFYSMHCCIHVLLYRSCWEGHSQKVHGLAVGDAVASLGALASMCRWATSAPPPPSPTLWEAAPAQARSECMRSVRHRTGCGSVVAVVVAGSPGSQPGDKRGAHRWRHQPPGAAATAACCAVLCRAVHATATARRCPPRWGVFGAAPVFGGCRPRPVFCCFFLL